MRPFKLILCLSFLLFVNITFAQQELKILPDNPLYETRRQAEDTNLNKTSDPLKKASLYMQYAEERLYEAKAMLSKEKPEFVNNLLKDYEKAINGAMDELNKAQKQGKDVNKAFEEVEKATQKHIEVLTDLLNKVPEKAKPAIAHALEVSKHGRTQALDALSKIQKGELPAGRPETTGKPEGIEKPVGSHGSFGSSHGQGKGRR